MPVRIKAPLVVAAEFRKYGVAGAGGVTVAVTVPLTACVALACAPGIGYVAYVPGIIVQTCVPLVQAVARTLKYFSALTDNSQA